MIRLGGNGVTAFDGDAAAYARAHRDFGYSAAYVPVALLGSDTAGLNAFEAAFAAADVVLAEVGIWRNLVTRDPKARKANLEHAINCLALADAVGARCAVTYIGSLGEANDYAPEASNFTPDAFDAAVETARYLIDTVKPTRTHFALEMMQTSLPDTVDSYLALIRAIDRPQFGAHLDPVNIIMTPRDYFSSGALIRECFDKLGPHLVSCHAKDIALRPEAALHFDEVQIGEGQLDYVQYLSQLNQLGGDVPLMLEHLPHEAYPLARDRVFAVGEKAGIGFVHRN